MTVISNGFANCQKSSRYLQQLVSHWSHKMQATWDDGLAEFPFSEVSHARMYARADGVEINLVTPDVEQAAIMREVIERHLDRFAFREAPLEFHWNA